MPKYLLCEDPRNPDGSIYILRTESPIILAEAHHFDGGQEEDAMKCKRAYSLIATLDYDNSEYIVIGAKWMSDNNAEPDTLAHYMSEMGDWYHDYLVWEDDQDADLGEMKE